jgi:hypothetical protein
MKTRILALIVVGIAVTLTAHAQVPGILNYQGRVVDAGTNFTGTGQFEFALVNPGGTTNYWSNDGTAIGQPSAAVSLTVTKGLYSVLLGQTTISNMTVAIPAAVFANSNVLLRVWFNDGVSGFQQLSPDQPIAAAGYAMQAVSAINTIPYIQLFNQVTNATFTVPANVTRITVEMWSAGGNGGSGFNNGSVGYTGGGGGAGTYALNVFTVTPGSSYLVTAPAVPAGSGQSGGAASFGALMSAGRGSGGGNATVSGNGAGGSGGTATGGVANVQGGSGDSSGNGGGSWRGGSVQLQSGAYGNGPGSGGSGGGPGPPASAGKIGNNALVLVYY